ncbi:hypothetical protein HDU96_009846, partial [Phlyctochytrium bullatum]
MVAYIWKYALKPQPSILNNTAVVLTALDRAYSVVSRQQTTQLTAREKGTKILWKIFTAITQHQEVAAPLCALYLLREDAVYWSHPHKAVALNPVMAILGDNPDAEVEVGIHVEDDDNGCEDPDSDDQHGDENVVDFAERKYDKLPDIDGDHVDPEEMETYYFILLILFYPHRRETFPSNGSKQAVFDEWVAANPELPAVQDAQKYMATCRDFHRSNAGCQQYGPNDEEECLKRHPCKEDHPDQTERRNGYFEAIPELDSFGEDEEVNPLDEVNLNLSIPESVELRLA